MNARLSLMVVAFVLLALNLPEDAKAQRLRQLRQGNSRIAGPSETTKRKNTRVTVEILTNTGAIALAAQRWRPVFENLGCAVRVRPGTSQDKIETREIVRGSLRQVFVVGRIDRKGLIQFEGESFSTRDSARMREWIRELETYGAQGTPSGKPLWGLTKTQYVALFTECAKPLNSEVAGKTLELALAAFESKSQYRFRMPLATEDWIRKSIPGEKTLHSKVKGMARGTALAIALNEFGLGFRPLRTPDGEIELVAERLDTVSDAWPIGRELIKGRAETAPKMFTFNQLFQDETPLIELLDKVAAVSEVPYHFDYNRIDQQGIDINGARVSHRERKGSWNQLIGSVTYRLKLHSQLLIDESGHPFVWITTLARDRRTQ